MVVESQCLVTNADYETLSLGPLQKINSQEMLRRLWKVYQWNWLSKRVVQTVLALRIFRLCIVKGVL